MNNLIRASINLERDQKELKSLQDAIEKQNCMIQILKHKYPNQSTPARISIQVTCNTKDTWDEDYAQYSSNLKISDFKDIDIERLIEILENTNADMQRRINHLENKYSRII